MSKTVFLSVPCATERLTISTNRSSFSFFTELEYFIDFERQDYQNQIDTAQQQGDIPPRMVPTPQMYSEYLKRQELVSSHAVGGLYRRYTMQDFFPDCCVIPGSDHFKEPGLWCGAPMAALRRIFQIIGDRIPESQLDQLWTLHKLYAREVTHMKLHDSTQQSAEQIEGGLRDSGTPSSSQTVAPVHANSGIVPPRGYNNGNNTPIPDAGARGAMAKLARCDSTQVGDTHTHTHKPWASEIRSWRFHQD
ncbi:hypothetical protein FOPE_10704 [Fonsecaea pedrosoi]|nr:hypothetical protein FOPE_10704 [Fonsecaea pedrosoi]